jgi:alpha-aminoadipate carrier protein LysW
MSGGLRMPKTYCPQCNATLGMHNPKIGHLFNCPACGTELEVVDIEPLEVYIPKDEDWYYDEDQEEDQPDNGRHG